MAGPLPRDSANRRHRVRVYRNPANQRLLIGIALVFLFLMVGNVADTDGPGAPSPESTALVTIALSALVLVLGYWRCYRAGVYAYDWGIIVVNPLRTRRIPWAAIESFSAGSHAGEYNVAIAHLADGEGVHLSGTAGWAPFLGKRLAQAPVRIAAELEEALRVAKGVHPLATPGSSLQPPRHNVST
jgi:Bacterial PH domain